MKRISTDELRAALVTFVEAVDASGGVTFDPEGYYTLVADEDWIDLAAAYVPGCAALRRQPILNSIPD